MYSDVGPLWAVVVIRMVSWRKKDLKIILKNGRYERKKRNIFR